MFKLEKVFQNNDSAYLYFTSICKSLLILITIYFFSILENNTIYDLANLEIYLNSKYFYFSILLSVLYYILSFFLKISKTYYRNFISFLREDVLNIVISSSIIFTIFFHKLSHD